MDSRRTMHRLTHPRSASAYSFSYFGANSATGSQTEWHVDRHAPARLGMPKLMVEPSRRFRNVLVPLDGTPLGESAVPLAVSIARQAGAELRLVHVHSPMESPYHQQPLTWFDDGVARSQRRYLDRMARRVAAAVSVPVVPTYMERRDAITGLCEAAERCDADLVVAATRAFGTWERWWRGSTAYQLLQRLETPVLVLRGDGILPAIARDAWLKRMTIALDGTAPSEMILPSAVALGSLFDASYSLLQVKSPERGINPRSDNRPGGEHYLQQVRTRMNVEPSRVDWRELTTNKRVADAIIAKSAAADCIALATRGRGGPSSLFWPSIAWQVIQQADVPVLVTRADQRES